jgi:hypothetical protein
VKTGLDKILFPSKRVTFGPDVWEVKLIFLS